MIAFQIDPARPGWVVELGAATGSVTERLLARGIAPKRLLVLESDPALVQFLRERYPDPQVVEGDAIRLPELLARYGVDRVHAVVCGVPLLSMPVASAHAIIKHCLNALDPDGRLFVPTYSWFTPFDFRRFGLAVRSVRRVLANIPPVSVWCYGYADVLARAAKVLPTAQGVVAAKVPPTARDVAAAEVTTTAPDVVAAEATIAIAEARSPETEEWEWTIRRPAVAITAALVGLLAVSVFGAFWLTQGSLGGALKDGWLALAVLVIGGLSPIIALGFRRR